MRFVGAVFGALLLNALVALPASAAGGFGEPSVVGAGPVVTAQFLAQPVAALGVRGDGALAWADGARVHVARRAPGGAWAAQTIARQADEVRDLQLVITRGGDTIAAWTQTYFAKRGLPDRFLVTGARRGRPFGRPQVIATGPRADAALPRMAGLADGRIVLIWRAARLPFGGELRLAFLGPGDRFGRSRGLGRDGVAPAVVATSDGGAVVAWAIPAKLHAPHPLRAARLPAGGLRLGRSFQFSAAAVAGARLAAGPGNVVIASWLSRRRPSGVLAARLLPKRGPVRILAAGLPHRDAATVAFGPDGSALATFPDSYPEQGDPAGIGPAGIGQWAASGTAAGGFAAPVPVTPTGASDVTTPHPAILPTGEAVVVWSQTRAVPGPFRFDVVMARRPPGSSAFAGIETLGPGSGLTLAQAAGRVLVAWPAPGPSGGLTVTER
jgi:hypothetical protein